MSVEQLYKRSKSRFIKKILPIVKNWELAEDLVQDATIVAMEKYHLYDPKRSKEETWFNCILFSTVWNWKRKEKRQVDLDDKPVEEFEELLIAASDGGLASDVDTSLVKNPLHRLALELHIRRGYSAKEIAALLQDQEGNLRKILQRVKKHL